MKQELKESILEQLARMNGQVGFYYKGRRVADDDHKLIKCVDVERHIAVFVAGHEGQHAAGIRMHLIRVQPRVL